MKLLYTATAYPPAHTGVPLHLHNLALSLMARHDIRVASLWDSNRSDWLIGSTVNAHSSPKEYLVDSVQVHRIGLNYRDKVKLAPLVAAFYPLMQTVTPLMAEAYLPYLRQIHDSVDIVHNGRMGRVPFSYASYQLAREYDVPFILTPTHHPRWTGWPYRAWVGLYRLADTLIALTEVERQTMISLGVQESKVRVTGHGPILSKTSQAERFREKYQLDNDPFILFLGQHRPYKGYRQLLEAAPLVWERFPDTRFVFVGPPLGNSEDYFKNTDYRICRTGSVDLQTKTDALAACTMLCLPSTQESFGGVIVEAWCFEKPVIGCGIPAVSEVIEDLTDGLIVKQDGASIACAVISLLDSPQTMSLMGSAGKKKVDEKYNWKAIGAKTELIYKEVLASG